MTGDLDIIARIEEKTGVKLQRLPMEEIYKAARSYGEIKRGYALDREKRVTGLRLDRMHLRPVLDEIPLLEQVKRLNLAYCGLEQDDIAFLLQLRELKELKI